MQDILKLKVVSLSKVFRSLTWESERRYPHSLRSEDDDASATFKSQGRYALVFGVRPDLIFI